MNDHDRGTVICGSCGSRLERVWFPDGEVQLPCMLCVISARPTSELLRICRPVLVEVLLAAAADITPQMRASAFLGLAAIDGLAIHGE
jgi:hypothetical protein